MLFEMKAQRIHFFRAQAVTGLARCALRAGDVEFAGLVVFNQPIGCAPDGGKAVGPHDRFDVDDGGSERRVPHAELHLRGRGSWTHQREFEPMPRPDRRVGEIEKRNRQAHSEGDAVLESEDRCDRELILREFRHRRLQVLHAHMLLKSHRVRRH